MLLGKIAWLLSERDTQVITEGCGMYYCGVKHFVKVIRNWNNAIYV